MCYSAQVWADYRKYLNAFGVKIGIREFFELFWRDREKAKIKIPRAMEAPFADPQTDMERQIKEAIDAFNVHETARLEQEIFKQRKRLADAERNLATKLTKAASESKRIATAKVEANFRRLDDLKRSDLKEKDSRIFPQYYAPVMIMENGQLVVKPMRYLCRPAGKPAFVDVKYPGTYNARRDSLNGYWKGTFGYTHGIVAINKFYENVNRHRVEGRQLGACEEPENVVLEFAPQIPQDMFIACLWARWSAEGQPDLLSFAAITDEPPPEVAAAGHDRCIIPIKRENINAWLNPDPANLEAQYAILDDRETPYYEHRKAA